MDEDTGPKLTLLTRMQIRELFQVSAKSGTRWIQRSALPVIEVRGTQRFHPDDVDRLFKERFRRRHRKRRGS